MNDNKINALSVLNSNVDKNLRINQVSTLYESLSKLNNFEQSSGTITTTTPGSGITNANYTCWNWWQDYYYPYIIRESYPVYIQERAKDKGKLAYELIKGLIDKNFLKLEKVKDFIEIMDFLIKQL
jgi:effector-binding domain-containing protein